MDLSAWTHSDWIAVAGIVVTAAIAAVGAAWKLHSGRRRRSVSTASPVTEPDIRWEIEHLGEATYILRNIGGNRADDVAVDSARTPALSRRLPDGQSISPGEGVKILLKGSWSKPMPAQLHLRWAGHADWVAVPIP